MTSKKIEAHTKKQISCFLPDAIAQALNSYHSFSKNPVADEAKDFTAHHNACKVAIAHIQLLIKLAKWADLPDANAEDGNNQILIAAMLQEAENEIEGYEEKDI